MDTESKKPPVEEAIVNYLNGKGTQLDYEKALNHEFSAIWARKTPKVAHEIVHKSPLTLTRERWYVLGSRQNVTRTKK